MHGIRAKAIAKFRGPIDAPQYKVRTLADLERAAIIAANLRHAPHARSPR
jgi:hypothetical protein